MSVFPLNGETRETKRKIAFFPYFFHFVVAERNEHFWGDEKNELVKLLRSKLSPLRGIIMRCCLICRKQSATETTVSSRKLQPEFIGYKDHVSLP